jgi:hypothetical protein
MAKYSKQWCDLSTQQTKLESEFDINEIANNLEPNHYTSIICEGFGFIAIGKTENNEIVLAMPTGESMTDENGQIFDNIVWEPYNNVIK